MKKLALVIEGMKLGRIEEYAAFLVMNESVVFPGIPQALHDIEMFGGEPVARIMREMRRLAEIRSTAFEPGRHHVPAGAAAADVVERGELARDVEGLAVAGGQRCDETDMRGSAGQRRQDGQRLEAVEVVRARFLGDEDAVGDKQKIELRRLGEFCLLLVIFKARARGRVAIRMAPVAPSHAHAVKHESQFKLTFLGHRKFPDGDLRRRPCSPKICRKANFY